MVFDFKKEYKELYAPSTEPHLVEVPPMNYIAVRGVGDPNEEGGDYQQSIQILYAIAYTIRMSYKGERQIEGYFPYVVPPLEGFWWQEGVHGVDYANKHTFNWISVIRLPDFVSEEDFQWAKEEASRKKKLDCSTAEFLRMDEGLCVQAMHLGPFELEPRTVAMMDKFLLEQGYEHDFSDTRFHHEIYLSDPRKVSPEKYKTVLRHPIRKAERGRIVAATKENFQAWLELGLSLWPEHSSAELEETFLAILRSEREAAFLYQVGGEYLGFINVSLRVDYVEGSNSSPVGYVEGIYVEERCRKQGVAKKLLEYGEAWAQDHGCSQMASDIEMQNTISYDFHLNVGFQEANRIICFIKDLGK